MALLVHIPYSPWSRRARLALDRLDLDLPRRAYVPVLSEPWLRAKLRRPAGRITLPVLLRRGQAPLTDSWDIVAWGQEQAGTEVLLPPALVEQVRAWADLADRAMEAGRLRTAERVLVDRDALTASLPPPIRTMGPVGRWIGRDATRRLIRKYPSSADAEPLRALCEAIHRARAETGDDTLLGTPTYADLAAACALAFVQPDAASKVPRAAQGAWTEPELVQAHPDVLAWRDRVLRASPAPG